MYQANHGQLSLNPMKQNLKNDIIVLLNTKQGHSDKISDISFANEGNVLATSCDDRFIRFFGLNQGKLN